MQNSQNKIRVGIRTLPLSLEAKDVFKDNIVKGNVVLKQVIKNYVKKLDDVEIFYEEDNCIVTNKGYHIARLKD